MCDLDHTKNLERLNQLYYTLVSLDLVENGKMVLRIAEDYKQLLSHVQNGEHTIE